MTQSELRKLLRYNPTTGCWTWLVSRGGRVVGDPAGQQTTECCQIKIDGKLYLAHRLAWLYMVGAWPRDEVDHKNLDRRDNRWDNLREATSGQNNTNKGLQRNNTSGLKGVTWHRATRKWAAAIRHDKHYMHLGLFDCPAAAYFVYAVNAAELHGEFARTR